MARRVQQLTDELHLTHDEVASIVGASARTVTRWKHGQSEPRSVPRKRLGELRYVAQEAAGVIEDEHISMWLFEPNKMLDGDSPADRIRNGRYKDALAVLATLGDGVVI
jgi:transcriptional regulator with XRE-family HTH domain